MLTVTDLSTTCVVVFFTLTLKITTAQVVKTSVAVNNNSPIQEYIHLKDHTQPTYEMTIVIISILFVFYTMPSQCYLHVCFGLLESAPAGFSLENNIHVLQSEALHRVWHWVLLHCPDH